MLVLPRVVFAARAALILMTCVLLPTAAFSAPRTTRTLRLQVEGMRCGSCSMGLAARMLKLPGVRSAEFAPEKKLGILEYEPAVVKPERILAGIRKAGYTARVRK